MKKIILFLILILLQTITLAQINGVIQWTQGQEFTFSKANEYDQIQAESNKYIEEIGHPQIPYCTKSFVIPSDTEISGIRINSIIKQQIIGSYNLYPVQYKISTAPHESIWTEPNGEIYNSANPYPGKYAEILSDKEDFGYHIVTIRFYPIEYIASTKIIYNCKINYSLNYTSVLKAKKAPTKAKQSERMNKLNQIYLKSIIENYSSQEVTPSLNISKAESQENSFSFEYAVPEYLIITNKKLKESFQELANWKIKKRNTNNYRNC